MAKTDLIDNVVSQKAIDEVNALNVSIDKLVVSLEKGYCFKRWQEPLRR